MSYRDDDDRRSQRDREQRQQGDGRRDEFRNDNFRSGYGGYDQQSAFSPAGGSQQGGYERDWGHDYHRDFRDRGDNNAATRRRDATGADWGAQRPYDNDFGNNTSQRDNTRRFSESQYDAGRRAQHGDGDWGNAAARRGNDSDYSDAGTRAGGYGYGSWDQDERWREQPGRRATGMGGSAYQGGQQGYGSSSGHSGPQGQGRGRHPDPDYHQWREEQIRRLDDDYDNWRQERYSKFSDEFSQWRSTRAQQQSQQGEGGAQQGGKPTPGARSAAVAGGAAGTGNASSSAQDASTNSSSTTSSRQQQHK